MIYLYAGESDHDQQFRLEVESSILRLWDPMHPRGIVQQRYSFEDGGQAFEEEVDGRIVRYAFVGRYSQWATGLPVPLATWDVN